MVLQTERSRHFRKETDVMMNKLIWIGLTVSLIGFVAASSAHADEWDQKTVLTFSQPVEIPGRVLPAGTYMFKLADLMGDRHIVQIFNADGSQIIATIMAIPDYRLKSTDQTVIKFGEVPAGSPETIRAWFYPGNTVGQEFVYPKSRAAQLAKASKTAVPALAVDVTSVDELKTAPIVAITPEQQETPVTAAIQTTPVANSTAPMANTASVEQPEHLPKTASGLPLVVVMALGSIVAAIGLMIFGKRTTATV